MRAFVTTSLLMVMGMFVPAFADEPTGNAAGFAGWSVFSGGQAIRGDNQQKYRSTPVAASLEKSGGADGSSWVLGAGYDFAIGDAGLFGVFANADLGHQSFNWSDAVSSAAFSHETNSRIDAGIRLGLVPNARQLIYLTGGYSLSDYTITSRGIGPLPPATTDDSSDGWFGGIGFDYRILDGVDLKTEYRVRMMGRGDAHIVGTRSWDFEPIDHALMVGLAVRPFRQALGSEAENATGYFDDRVSFYAALAGSGGIFHADWQGYNGTSKEGRAGEMAALRASAGLDVGLSDMFFGGAVASYEMRNGKSSDTQSAASSHEIEIGDAWSVGLRAGLRNEAGLVYVGGGYLHSSLDAVHFNSAVIDINDGLNGYYANLGTEVALNQHLGMQLEYRLENYSALSRDALPVDQEIDMTAQSVSAGLVLRY